MSYHPTHPELFQVEFGPEGTYTSRLVACRDFKSGSIICPIEHITDTDEKSYLTVQVGVEPDSALTYQLQAASTPHIKLNSDLVYANHSCQPTISFEVPQERAKWFARALMDIPKGESLTFFYPTTEWRMSQPFKCFCASPQCLGEITGAEHMDETILRRYDVQPHIRRLKTAQVESRTVEAGRVEGVLLSCEA